MLNRLQSVSGADFDNVYKRMMIMGHSGVLPVVQREMRTGHDADIRSYAVNMESAVKYHLRLAQQQTTMLGNGKSG
jgi:putative membrane protein